MQAEGPRKSGLFAAVCWGLGFLLGALGIELHALWLVYLGYGVIGGTGLGLGYITPVSTLIACSRIGAAWPRAWPSWASAAGR